MTEMIAEMNELSETLPELGDDEMEAALLRAGVDEYDEASLRQLNADVKAAASSMTTNEVRFLVDTYYHWQEAREAAGLRIKSLEKMGQPAAVLAFTFAHTAKMEREAASLLDWYSKVEPTGMGAWARSVCGIGPVIASGLRAHIDITQAPTVGHIWRLAGLDPTLTWLGKEGAAAMTREVVGDAKKVTADHLQDIATRTNRRVAAISSIGTDRKTHTISVTSLTAGLARRPWNGGLKTLCWKLGESFVKVSNKDGDVYGKEYKKRKEYEQANNLLGRYADQAREKLVRNKIGRDTDAILWYGGRMTPEAARTVLDTDATKREGLARRLAGPAGSGVPMLPPGHIQARAKRYAVKLFLAHYHQVAYVKHYGTEPPLPYPIAHLGHAHMIAPPVAA